MPIPPLHNERELLARLAAGEEEAFTQIYHHYSGGIYEAALAYLQDETMAGEIVQEIFLKVWDKRTQLPEIKRLDDFLFILARNCIFDHFRKKALDLAVRKKLRMYHTGSVNDTDFRIQEQQYRQVLQTAIDSLPPQRQKIYLLAKEEGLTYDEIAGKMGLSRFTVKNQMAQALQFIRSHVHQHLDTLVFSLLWLHWGLPHGR